MKTIIKNKVAKTTLFKDLGFGQWFYLINTPTILHCKITKYNTLCITNKGISLFNFDPDEEVIKIDSIEITAK